jgi:hypothetical protein
MASGSDGVRIAGKRMYLWRAVDHEGENASWLAVRAAFIAVTKPRAATYRRALRIGAGKSWAEGPSLRERSNGPLEKLYPLTPTNGRIPSPPPLRYLYV